MAFRTPEVYRRRDHDRRMGYASEPGYGSFQIPPETTVEGITIHRYLLCIASCGMGWEHVSVHSETHSGGIHTPSWDEMCVVKALFWGAEDRVVQYHPPASEYVRTHPHVLHLWRPTDPDVYIPHPPYYLVGMKDGQTKEEALRDAERDEAATRGAGQDPYPDVPDTGDRLRANRRGYRKP